MFHQVWLWYQASGLSHAMISIPGMEAIVLLIVLTICLLCRITRTGLMIAYIFTYRWGLLFGEQYFAGNARVYHVFLTSYIVFGIVVLTLALVAMMVATRSGRQE
ncbi:MAG: hypothetical protein L6437_07015 [Kiritimatiellae bacterium]|nr:hypothetical protein [Verrucomicrobiota bacterium]MBU4285281.1 hypothetical protein [Verrucomicrobiota bacterium]MCG2659977.1 hypothetical protein [Kiritimatiellia bacterium]